MYNIESRNSVKKIILKILESGQTYSFSLIEQSMDANPMLIRACIWELINENEIKLCNLLDIRKEEKMKPATNNPELEFKSLTSEEWREYTFPFPGKPGGEKVRIDNPQALNVSKTGGHRIQAENGNGIYIPSGWIKLEWKNKDTEKASIQF